MPPGSANGRGGGREHARALEILSVARAYYEDMKRVLLLFAAIFGLVASPPLSRAETTARARPSAPVAAARGDTRATTTAFAEWGGSFWLVTVSPVKAGASRTGGTFRIHYVGWGNEWDETVGCDRLRREGGGELLAEWHGAFYPVTVVREDSAGTRVHYTGYDDSWDETVPVDRLARIAPYCAG
jgi:hypothetical protein